eukprot:15475580-Alexandrium_andersonii.AAC.1
MPRRMAESSHPGLGIRQRLERPRLRGPGVGGSDVRLASESNRVANASRIAGLQLASESKLGVGLPDLR